MKFHAKDFHFLFTRLRQASTVDLHRIRKGYGEASCLQFTPLD